MSSDFDTQLIDLKEAYTKAKLNGNASDVEKNPDPDLLLADKAAKAVRRSLLEKLLPIRGTLYGEPVDIDKMKVLFPKGVRWPSEAWLSREKACKGDPLCDETLAFSVYRFVEHFTDLTVKAYRFVPRFHQWRLALGGDDDQVPRIATMDRYDGIFPTAWDYVRSVMTQIDIFNMFGLPLGRVVIGFASASLKITAQ